MVATGYNAYGQCDVTEWSNIKQIACGTTVTYALSYDGTVSFNKPEHYGRFDKAFLSAVDDAVAVTNNSVLHADHSVTTIGLIAFTFTPDFWGLGESRYFERVVGVEGNQFEANVMQMVFLFAQMDDGNWIYCDHLAGDYGSYVVIPEFEDALYIAPGFSGVAGLFSDGTVVPATLTHTWYQLDFSGELDHYGEFACGEWTDIIALAGNTGHNYQNIVFYVGVHEDGTAVAAGYNEAGQCNVESWTDIGYPYHLASKIVEPASLSFAALSASGEAEA